MRNLLYVLLTVVSILFTSCGPSSSTNNPQEPNVPQPQPQPQPEVTQKVVIGYLPLDDWEFESLFPSIEWKYLTHINVEAIQLVFFGECNHLLYQFLSGFRIVDGSRKFSRTVLCQ